MLHGISYTVLDDLKDLLGQNFADGPGEIARDRCSKSLEPYVKKKNRRQRQPMSAVRTARRQVPLEHHTVPVGTISGNDETVHDELSHNRNISRIACRLIRKLNKRQREQILNGELSASEVAKNLGGSILGFVPEENKQVASLLMHFIKDLSSKQYFLSSKEAENLQQLKDYMARQKDGGEIKAQKQAYEEFKQKYGIYKLLEELDPDKLIWPSGMRKKYHTVSKELELLIKAQMGQVKRLD